MATRRLYYDDSYLQSFQARVVECVLADPFRTASGTVPVWEVVLDRSAFYPTSGGQPNDVGRIENARVLDVREENQEIVHIVDQELPRGEIQACIDWSRRFDNMQQHTGQHLLSAICQERYGLPTVSFHLGSELCTIDLSGPEPTTGMLEGAQRAANTVIFEDRPVNVRYGTAEQMAELGVRKEVERQGILRAIEIESADLQPCGGTHVRTTGQIGLILVRRCTKIRQDWRLQFACGARAERLATGDFQLLRSIAEKLSCAQEDSLRAVEKVASEREANFKSLRTTLQQLAESRAKQLGGSFLWTDSVRVIDESLKEESPELLLPLATELAKNERTVALLVHEPTGQLVFAQHPTAGKDLAGLLRQLRAVIPAEGGGTRDFVRAKLVDPVHSSTALELAKKMALVEEGARAASEGFRAPRKK